MRKSLSVSKSIFKCVLIQAPCQLDDVTCHNLLLSLKILFLSLFLVLTKAKVLIGKDCDTRHLFTFGYIFAVFCQNLIVKFNLKQHSFPRKSHCVIGQECRTGSFLTIILRLGQTFQNLSLWCQSSFAYKFDSFSHSSSVSRTASAHHLYLVFINPCKVYSLVNRFGYFRRETSLEQINN